MSSWSKPFAGFSTFIFRIEPTLRLFFRADLFPQPAEWIVEFIHDTFLKRNDRVVGDRDVFGTNFRAALGDVAETNALRLL